MTPSSLIEVLEPRIAPALTIINSTTATYTDLDGDLVTVKVSKPVMTEAAFIFFPVTAPQFRGQQLGRLAVDQFGDVRGLSIRITATPQDADGDGRKDGDGLVNIGEIDTGRPGLDLGNVFVDGDLAVIRAGDADRTTTALKSLTVKSLGAIGRASGANDLFTIIRGSLGKLTVTGDVRDALILLEGNLGSASIGGSLIGGIDEGSGSIAVQGTIGLIKVRGDVIGSLGVSSGTIRAGGSLKSVIIGGSLIGGVNTGSGSIQSGLILPGDMGAIKIGRDLVGGSVGAGSSGIDSGAIIANGSIASVTIGGSILGGTADNSGSIRAATVIGPTFIGRDVVGGRGEASGQITAESGIARLSIAGSLLGGQSLNAGSIVSSGHVGSIKIGRDIVGGETYVNGGASADFTGVISVLSAGNISVRGSLIGGIDTLHAPGVFSTVTSGAILATGDIRTVTIGRDVVGTNTVETGFISSGGNLGKVSIGGSLIGGSGHRSGMIESLGAIGSVRIGGDIQGGSSLGALTDSGTVQGERIASLLVGGSIVAGTRLGDNALLLRSGSVHAMDDIGSIVVKGSLVGNFDTQVLINARGEANPSNTADVALRNLTVGGSVEFAQIQIGFDRDQLGQNADAQVGKVRIGGDWRASSLIAGVNPGPDRAIGTSDDSKLSGDFGAGPVKDAGPISKIAGIVIRGQVRGAGDSFATFGIGAEQVQSVQINGTPISLTRGASNDTSAIGSARPLGSSRSPLTFDQFAVHVFEV